MAFEQKIVGEDESDAKGAQDAHYNEGDSNAEHRIGIAPFEQILLFILHIRDDLSQFIHPLSSDAFYNAQPGFFSAARSTQLHPLLESVEFGRYLFFSRGYSALLTGIVRSQVFYVFYL